MKYSISKYINKIWQFLGFWIQQQIKFPSFFNTPEPIYVNKFIHYTLLN